MRLTQANRLHTKSRMQV